jgi:hypothetical protein
MINGSVTPLVVVEPSIYRILPLSSSAGKLTSNMATITEFPGVAVVTGAASGMSEI